VNSALDYAPTGPMLAPMAQRVLVVEDEEDIAFPLVRTLEREGYDVEWVESGQKALDTLATMPELVILDLGLPDIDGLEVCRRAREAGYTGAIMIVTARAGELDRVVGLDYGADDYLAKPFGLAELQARVRALLRRTSSPLPGAVDEAASPDGVRIDVEARRVYAGTDEVPLTGKEFEVLSILAANRDKVVSRGRLMADVWDENWYGSTKTLDVTIGRLRQKLESVGVTDRVVAVRGVGFRLEGGPVDA
jgi:DNA-binding response OmpR family regulator